MDLTTPSFAVRRKKEALTLGEMGDEKVGAVLWGRARKFIAVQMGAALQSG
jgi:hypothetical protein